MVGYMIEIQASVTDTYAILHGWDEVYDTRKEGEALCRRAENLWHAARVFEIDREVAISTYAARHAAWSFGQHMT